MIFKIWVFGMQDVWFCRVSGIFLVYCMGEFFRKGYCVNIFE